MRLVLDASPWGIGGVLLENGIIVSWFASQLLQEDANIHKKSLGDSAGQQVWEALCVLVAVRAWIHRWASKRVTITVKSDNIAALSMLANLKSKASPLIARELALTLSRAAFQPRFIDHVPGVMNAVADNLSRLWEPGAAFQVPEHLPPHRRLFPGKRSEAYYRTLQPNELLVG